MKRKTQIDGDANKPTAKYLIWRDMQIVDCLADIHGLLLDAVFLSGKKHPLK